MTEKKLYEADHLCMMKLALIKKKSTRKTTTSRYHSFIVKTTSHIRNAEKVPNFAARWCSIRKYLIQSKASNQEKQHKIQQRNEKYTTRLQANEKEFRPTTSKTLLFSFQLIKTDINTMRSLAAKIIEDALRQFYAAIITI